MFDNIKKNVFRSLSRSDQLEERKQYGIDYVDDYDYLQHLKTRTDCTLEPLPDNITVIENKKEKPNVQVGYRVEKFFMVISETLFIDLFQF